MISFFVWRYHLEEKSQNMHWPYRKCIVESINRWTQSLIFTSQSNQTTNRPCPMWTLQGVLLNKVDYCETAIHDCPFAEIEIETQRTAEVQMEAEVWSWVDLNLTNHRSKCYIQCGFSSLVFSTEGLAFMRSVVASVQHLLFSTGDRTTICSALRPLRSTCRSLKKLHKERFAYALQQGRIEAESPFVRGVTTHLLDRLLDTKRKFSRVLLLGSFRMSACKSFFYH